MGTWRVRREQGSKALGQIKLTKHHRRVQNLAQTASLSPTYHSSWLLLHLSVLLLPHPVTPKAGTRLVCLLSSKYTEPLAYEFFQRTLHV